MASSPAKGTCVIVSMSLPVHECAKMRCKRGVKHDKQEGFGEAVVDEVHGVGVDARDAHEEVLWLDVAVHEAVLVEHLQAPQLLVPPPIYAHTVPSLVFHANVLMRQICKPFARPTSARS